MPLLLNNKAPAYIDVFAALAKAILFRESYSSIDMYNNDVGKKSAQKIMKQTGDLKAATLYFAS